MRRKRKAADRLISKEAFEVLHKDKLMSSEEKADWYFNQPGPTADRLDAAYAMHYNSGLSHEEATQAAQQDVFGKVRSDKVGKQNLQNVEIAQAARAVANPNYREPFSSPAFTAPSIPAIKLEGAPQAAVLQLPHVGPSGLVSLTLAAQLLQGLTPDDAPQNQKLI